MSNDKSCSGCLLSSGSDPKANELGGIIRLSESWVLNHYGGNEGYLGWLALQPFEHRMDLTLLEDQEALEMGNHIKRVQKLLKLYWKQRFPEDHLDRIYIAYFFESTFNVPPSPYHMHLHLIPRPRSVELLLREYTDRNKTGRSSINAWKVPALTLQGCFPDKYRKCAESYKLLMSWLRDQLGADTPGIHDADK